ncbi:alkaline phosphatase family protein [Paenarthrobacter sp. PH39-S1]|uniref:alkaline phosphatase family protein n=1 Tax=Paenarthrobacter sp. PH39-S1 TaxID=3046204 RepID=UPI0024BB1D1F|nr:alkaline phosphatase family protein [Paenarthrobacter sp. PH39-S1]MDJ0356829.1 alkaline phosphatase family protein [Paenarthrobacter sp. PH39-S1]
MLFLSVLTLVLATGCVAESPTAGPPSPLSSQDAAQNQQGTGTPTTGTASRGLKHVVIIVEENKPSSNIIGNAAAPFINKLAADYSLATNYQAVTHPSLPNYLALTSGTNAGITNDCNPPGGDCTARVPALTGEIQQSGRIWKMYAEGMPAPCTPNNSGSYAVKHNPFMYYPSVTDNKATCAAHDVPFSQLGADLKGASTLPDYAFISPDMCNDMHDCSVQTGDTWLSQQVPQILASPAFTTQNSLLVITWDEGSGANNKVSTIFAGPAAKKVYTSDVAYSHYSLLHTIESSWGLAPLTGNDSNAPIMTDMLR